MKRLTRTAIGIGLAALSQLASATYIITGEVSPSVNITNSTLVLMMNACAYYNYGNLSPCTFTKDSTAPFWTEIDGGVSTPDDINDKRYAFFGTYMKGDGTIGVVVSMNPLVANSVIGNLSFADVFNSDGYGVDESSLVQAIADAGSEDWDIYEPARQILSMSLMRLNSLYVNDGNEDIWGTSQLDQNATLVCFSSAAYGGTIRSTAGQPVPGPGVGISMAIGLAAVAIKKRRRS